MINRNYMYYRPDNTYTVSANGVYYGVWQATSADQAMQYAADEIGNPDVGDEHASTDGMQARTISDWSDSLNTHPAVAIAIHAIASGHRGPDEIWRAPTQPEWDHVAMAVQEYVDAGDVDMPEDRAFDWGQEVLTLEGEG